MNEVEQLFSDIYAEYPHEFRPILKGNKARIIWQVAVVRQHVRSGGRIVDIGSGIVPFMLICQKLGYQTVVIDDLEDATYKTDASSSVLKIFRESGMECITADAFTDSLDGLEDLELVTSHDSMEHWHNSPKRMFHKFWSKMNDGAFFFLGVPNCVNLRKRITVPFGRGKWSQMTDWYEPDVFRGHVREPDVDDLRYIARDLKASSIQIMGRNWIGYRHTSRFIRTVTPVIDRTMQFFPSICSDIYLLARK